ncbi:MAG: carbamoyltransferase HypF [Deltaproteobacteria bacterium]|nr:carbamoyltransferase HypF [Deltaproteobacteria bacterium]
MRIRGIVQGVGFRPFVYNLAMEHGLFGYVLNNSSGVLIDVEGGKPLVDEFILRVRTRPPPLAVIFDMQVRELEPAGYEEFTIKASDGDEEKFVPISPEIATCPDCLEEIFDPSDRRHRYPFTNCTNCGPRFTIVKDIPYDRKFTTMDPFEMCPQCRAEYENPMDRRFHAQPNACPACGPRLSLFHRNGAPVRVPDVLAESCRLLKEGAILAVKGLGGYHLACDALNEEAVTLLRSRKYREYKPFAVMVRDVDAARRICEVGEEEEKLLTGIQRPIVLLRKRPDCPTAGNVSPNQKFHGLMLPYTPLHHLLVRESGLVLVMTSGNLSSEPIVYKDDDSMEVLKGIADYYLLHDREIHIRTDDSVCRVWRGQGTMLRRSRGYVPFPLLMPFSFRERILSCGAELKNAFSLTRGNFVFMSHHIGDLENLETFTSFEEGIRHFKRIFNIEPTAVAYDLHPEYLSTKYAHSLDGIRKIGVQHHHAHIVSCMGDNGIGGEIIGVSFDGTGYGTDGKIWGGEFLVCDEKGFRRAAHFEYFPLPGGEKAIKQPWRIAAALLDGIYGDGMFDLGIDFVKDIDRGKWAVIRKMIERGLNSPLTSSAGRLFDAVSALLGIRKEIHYEGQAAIELEMAALEDAGSYPFRLRGEGDGYAIVLEPLIREMIADLQKGTACGILSARFHNTMTEIVLHVCRKIREESGLDRVALSGGVFQNTLLLERAHDLLRKDGLSVFIHHRVPPNDGGIALGQSIIAEALIAAGQ